MKQDRDWQKIESDLCQRFDVVDDEVEVAARRYRVLRPRSADDLIDEEAFDRDERLPYWAEIWPSGVLLAQHLAKRSGDGQRCLELGAGCGLPGLVAASAGFEVVVSDYYPEALEFVELNAWRNELENVHTRLIDWRAFPNDLPQFDLVIGGDVLYETKFAELIAEGIKRTLAPTGEAIITDPSRKTAEVFEAACPAFDFKLRRGLPVATEHGGVRHSVVTYWVRHG